jgi:hypothetical protein
MLFINILSILRIYYYNEHIMYNFIYFLILFIYYLINQLYYIYIEIQMSNIYLIKFLIIICHYNFLWIIKSE